MWGRHGPTPPNRCGCRRGGGVRDAHGAARPTTFPQQFACGAPLRGRRRERGIHAGGARSQPTPRVRLLRDLKVPGCASRTQLTGGACCNNEKSCTHASAGSTGRHISRGKSLRALESAGHSNKRRVRGQGVVGSFSWREVRPWSGGGHHSRRASRSRSSAWVRTQRRRLAVRRVVRREGRSWCRIERREVRCWTE